MTEELTKLREALRRVKHEATSLADAQVIALEALTLPAAQNEREAFEAWAEANVQSDYSRSDRHCMWWGWQARASLPTQPAQAAQVPEGLPAVLTDWGFDVHDDDDGRTCLTIRNPDDDVARMSVPTVWPLNGNQTIAAVVLHQFGAALTSALTAAQQGADHG